MGSFTVIPNSGTVRAVSACNTIELVLVTHRILIFTYPVYISSEGSGFNLRMYRVGTT